MAAEKEVLKRHSSIIEPPSAGILIIGDEILKGHTKDTNSQFFLTRLWSLGVKVKAVSVISDDVDEIASHVCDFASRFTYVLTSGGIGPTHDDVTMMAIAKAFDDPLVQNEHLADTLVELYDVKDISELSSFDLKMAQIPSSCKLSYGQCERTWNLFPLISIHNVYIFPGIPKLLESLFDCHVHLFSNQQSRFYLRKLYLSVDESVVAAELQKVHDKYGHRVHLGSYPEIGCKEFQTKLTLESLKPNILAEAMDYLTSMLPDNSIVRTESCSSGETDSLTNGMITKLALIVAKCLRANWNFS